MPGSIHVSVLDFKELPSSSNSVKVSLGKVEYEAGNKGTFSFPLTNLRDNLIITVHDSEGNQVSHSGVRTKSIIEKGAWDDFFPIEGGGIIHMKLQFILSDEERNRIRSMRESAMKKKQEEILNSRIQNAESVAPFASSLRRLEVSDVLTATSSQDFQTSSVKAGILTVRVDTSGKAAESGDVQKDESFQIKTVPNATGRTEETSSSPMTEAIRQKVSVENTETQAPLTNSKASNYQAEVLDKPNLEEQETKVNSTKNNDIQLKQADVPKILLEQVRQKASVDDIETRESTEFVMKSKAAESRPSDNLVKLDKSNLEQQETEVNATKNNDIQLKQADVPEGLQERVRQKASVEETETQESTDFGKKNKDAESKASENLVKLDKPNLEQQETEVNSTKNNNIPLQQADVPEGLREWLRQKESVEVIEARELTDFVKKKKKEAESKPSKQNLEEKVPSFVKKTSKTSTPTPFQETELPERLQKSIISENIKSFSSKFSGEPDKRGPPDKTRNIRKMISVFESSISQDRVPIKPVSTKSHRVETSRLLKDHAVKDHSEKSESSSRRLRNSFSTGDLQKDDLSFIKTGEQIGFDSNFVEPSETNMQSKEKVESAVILDDPKETETKDSTTVASVDVNNEEKFALKETNTKELPKSSEEDATVSGRTREEDKESNTKQTENISDEHDGGMSLLGDCVIEEKTHQEETVSFIPENIMKGELRDGIVEEDDDEMVCVSGNSSPKSSNEEASTGSIGQVVKIALVVGFGVIVLLFRQREQGKTKKKENERGLKTRVFMNKRGSIEEQLRKIDVLKLS